MTHPTAQARQQHWRAFTIIELLVVISIILIMAGIVFPMLSTLQRSGRVEAGVTTVSAAIASTRAFTDVSQGSLDPDIPGAEYSGVAAIFSGSEIRITENDQLAKNGSNQYLESLDLNGFKDIEDVESIKVPHGVGIVGIIRNATGAAGLKLLPPPFAIHFDAEGHLVHTNPSNPSSRERMVFYDGNGNGYDTSQGDGGDRANTAYDPDQYDGDASQYQSSNFNSSTGRINLPFEEMRPVIGVVIYDKYAWWDAHGNNGWTSKTNNWWDGDDSKGEWLLENGRPIFFSRQTGAAVREGYIPR